MINERIVVSAPITYEERIPATSVSQFNVGLHEIGSAGALTIDDVLRQVPGFSLFRRSGGLTTNPTAQGVSLRGVGASGASRALVLLDGVPLNSPFGGWVYWNRVPRVNIENVSVQNGGNSSLYGCGALGGVVNITSETRWGTGLDVEVSAGNEGTAVTSFTAGKILGDWAIVAAGQALHTNGYVLVPENQRGSVDTAAGNRRSRWLDHSFKRRAWFLIPPSQLLWRESPQRHAYSSQRHAHLVDRFRSRLNASKTRSGFNSTLWLE